MNSTFAFLNSEMSFPWLSDYEITTDGSVIMTLPPFVFFGRFVFVLVL